MDSQGEYDERIITKLKHQYFFVKKNLKEIPELDNTGFHTMTYSSPMKLTEIMHTLTKAVHEK